MKTDLSAPYPAAILGQGSLIGLLAFLGLVAATSVGCSSEGPITGGAESACHVSMNVTLPSSALTTDSWTQIRRAGADFLLTGRLDGRSISWARSTKDGVLGPQVDPAAIAGTHLHGLALAGKVTAADQLIAITSEDTDQINAAAMDVTTGIAGPTHVVMNAQPYTGQTIQTLLTSSLDGQRAVFVDGNITLEDPQVIVLGGDGVRQGAQVSIATTTGHLWDCLDVVPTVTSGAISTVEIRDKTRFWHLVELDANGARVFESSVELTDLDKACPEIVLTSSGFTGRFVGTDGVTVLLTVNRATFAPLGAARLELSTTFARRRLLASVGNGYALLSDSAIDGAPVQVRLIDESAHPLGNDLHIPLPAGIVRELIPSAPGTLLVETRDGDGPWGWLEVTCAGG